MPAATSDKPKTPRFRVPPLVVPASALAAGIVLDRSRGEPLVTADWAWLALFAAGVAVTFRRRTQLVPSLLILAWLSLGAAWHHAHWFDRAPDDLSRSVPDNAPPRPAWIKGILVDPPIFRPGDRPDDSGQTRAMVDVEAVREGPGWRGASGRLMVRIRGDASQLVPGVAVQAAGALGQIEPAKNPGEFDARDYYRSQGIRLNLSVEAPMAIWSDPDRPGSAWLRWLGRMKVWSYDRLISGLPASTAPLAAALLLGRRDLVDPDTNDAFARTGTTHLLAISGLHLQVLAVAVGLALRLAGLRRRAVFGGVAGATIGYALLVGLAPSVVRSAAMTCAVCLAGLRSRPTLPSNILAIAALATLALDPSDLFDVGCQLSFLAVAAIVWVVPLAKTLLVREADPLDALEAYYESGAWRLLRRFRTGLLDGIRLSAVVWVVGLPLVLLRFHMVAPIGILLNIPLIPITSLALLAAGMTLALSAVWAPLGVPTGLLCGVLLNLTERLVAFGAAVPYGHWFDPGPTEWWVVGSYVLLSIAVVGQRAAVAGRAWLWGALGLWCVVGLPISAESQRPRRLEAQALAVGHGLAVVIQSPEGSRYLYDCGKLGDPRVGRRIVAPALWSRGIRRLDAVILSHADSDHYNGLPDLLDRVRVGEVWMPPGFGGEENPGAIELLDLLKRKGIPLRVVKAGDSGRIDSTSTWRSLHPPQGWGEGTSDNARSLVLEVASGGRKLLLTGDLEKSGLPELVALPSPPDGYDAMLAPHHGGRTANPGWLYDWARPGIVVASQRALSATSRDALSGLAVDLFRTWQRGAVTLTWGASGLIAAGYLDPEPSAISDSTTLLSMALPWWSRTLIVIVGLLIGLGLSLGMAVVEWGAWLLVLPGRRKDSFAKPEEPASRLGPGERIELIASDGVRLVGYWHPADMPDGRVALFLHGLAETGAGMRSRACVLRRHGWGVAILDARAHGQSHGDRASFGGRESNDLKLWLDHIPTRMDEPIRSMVVWGRSMGAAVAMQGATEDVRISALVLESPFANLESTVAHLLRRYRVPTFLARSVVRRAEQLAGVPLADPPPIELAARIEQPIVLLHGADDRLVPVAEVRRIRDACKGPATLIEVPGAGHANIVGIGGEELLNKVTAELHRRLDR